LSKNSFFFSQSNASFIALYFAFQQDTAFYLAINQLKGIQKVITMGCDWKISFFQGLLIVVIIEGFRAKRAYTAFRQILISRRVEPTLGRLTCFDNTSIVL